MRVVTTTIAVLAFGAITTLFPSEASSEDRVVAGLECGEIDIQEDWSVGDQSDDALIGFVTTVCVDSVSNIYATDIKMQCIYVFNDQGHHLQTYGTPGEGPGDLMFGAVMAMDKQSRIYMTGMGGRVQLLDTNWKYVGEFVREHPENIARAIAVTPAGRVFIGAVDIIEQTAFDVYDPDFVYLGSFSETFGAGSNLDWRTESLFAGGYLAANSKGELYYVQMTPFEVRKFDEDIELVATTSAIGGNFVPPPPEVEFAGNTAKVSLNGAASGIVVLDSGDVVVTAYRKEEGKETTSLIVVYSSDLVPLAEQEIRGVYSASGRDNDNRVFFSVDDERGPRLVRSRLVY